MLSRCSLILSLLFSCLVILFVFSLCSSPSLIFSSFSWSDSIFGSLLSSFSFPSPSSPSPSPFLISSFSLSRSSLGAFFSSDVRYTGCHRIIDRNIGWIFRWKERAKMQGRLFRERGGRGQKQHQQQEEMEQETEKEEEKEEAEGDELLNRVFNIDSSGPDFQWCADLAFARGFRYMGVSKHSCIVSPHDVSSAYERGFYADSYGALTCDELCVVTPAFSFEQRRHTRCGARATVTANYNRVDSSDVFAFYALTGVNSLNAILSDRDLVAADVVNALFSTVNIVNTHNREKMEERRQHWQRIKKRRKEKNVKNNSDSSSSSSSSVTLSPVVGSRSGALLPCVTRPDGSTRIHSCSINEDWWYRGESNNISCPDCVYSESSLTACTTSRSPFDDVDILVFRDRIPDLDGARFLSHHHAVAIEGLEPARIQGITNNAQLRTHIIHSFNEQWADVVVSYAAPAELPRLLPPHSSPVSPADGSVKLSAVFVSNCLEPRLSLLHRFPISFFGNCAGDNANSRAELDDLKARMNVSIDVSRSGGHRADSKHQLLSAYKFVVSIENSIEYGYSSEKFFASFMLPGVLVYMGQPSLRFNSPCRLLPFACFINILDFPSIEHVIEHMWELEDDYGKLVKYTQWKTIQSAFEIANQDFKDHAYGMSMFTNPQPTTGKTHAKAYIPNLCKMCTYYRDHLCEPA